MHYRAGHVVSRNAIVKGRIADIGAQLNGVVTSVAVTGGDRVQAGQIMARLEDRHLQARVQQARSRLEKASRELEVERLAIAHERKRLQSWVTEMSAQLTAAEAQLEAAQIRAEDAEQRHTLRQSLAQKGVIPNEEVRDAEAERRTASALMQAAKAQYKAAAAAQHSAEVESDGLTVREERITVLQSEIAAFGAELAVAEADLEGSVIRAPDEGRVVRRIVEPGGSVVVGQPLISFWISEDVWVEAWIGENDLPEVELGSVAKVTIKSYPDREFSGIVETIGVSTDFELPDSEVPQPRHARMRGTPVVGVRIRLEDPPEDLFPGLSAVVGIRKKSR
jgi:multidrug resistance efflux pump